MCLLRPMNCGFMIKSIYEQYLNLLWILLCMSGYLCKSLRIISLVWPTRLVFQLKWKLMIVIIKLRIKSLPNLVGRRGCVLLQSNALSKMTWCRGIDSCNMMKTPSCYPWWQQYNTCLAAPTVTGKGHRKIEPKAKHFSHCKKDQSSRPNQTDNSKRLAKITNHT